MGRGPVVAALLGRGNHPRVQPRPNVMVALKLDIVHRLSTDLDGWLTEYNEARPHQGRWCYGKAPLQTFIDSTPLAREKILFTAAAAGAVLTK